MEPPPSLPTPPAESPAAIAADSPPLESAGRARQVPGAVRAAVQRVVRLPRHQLLGDVRHAQDDRAGRAGAADERGVAVIPDAATERAACLPRHSGDGNRALDAERDAVQWSERVPSQHRGIRVPRLPPGPFSIDEHERVQRRIERLDALEMGVHELDH